MANNGDDIKKDFERLTEELKEMEGAGPRLARMGLKEGATVFEVAIREEATIANSDRKVEKKTIVPGGEKASIGKTVSRTNSSGVVYAKVGPGVGKDQVPNGTQVTRGSGKAVAYSHLDIQGTRQRWTGAIVKRPKKLGQKIRFKLTGNKAQNRGVMRSNPYVVRAVASVQDAALNAVVKKIDEGIARIRAKQ